MTWKWKYEDESGNAVGESAEFESQSDAETWIGTEFEALLDDGVAQVNLYDGDDQVYGPMLLSA